MCDECAVSGSKTLSRAASLPYIKTVLHRPCCNGQILGAPDLNSGTEKSENAQKAVEAEIIHIEAEVKEKPEGILKPAAVESEQVNAVEEPASKKGWRRRKKGQNAPEKKKLVAPWKLYRFAKCSDVLMMFLAVLGAIVTGAALPIHMLMFGQVISRFVYFSIALPYYGKVRSLDYLMKLAAKLNLTNNTYYCNKSNTLDTNLLNQYLNSTDIKAELGDIVSVFSYYYVALATTAMLGAFAANLMSNISAYRQTRRMRIAFYNSVLRQEVGWFDTTKTGQLNTRLQDDTEKIQSGIGDKVAVFLQYTTTFVVGYVIAFTKSWKLSLVLATMVPMLVIMAAAIAKVIASFTFREQKAYASAGAVAEEVLSSIRTVVAFGGEEKEVERYNVVLKKARTEGLKKGLSVSLVTGGIFFILYCMYALGFWYGAVLITQCELAAGDVVTVFFSIMIGSFSLGNALPEIQTFSSAIGSASAVFDIIDRVSAIDPASEQGERPDTLTGNIEFSDVVFNYPARPDVQILHGLDLKIKVGQTVALVGPSGCGKSTTVQLIQRFYDPNGGQVTIDGKNIKDLNLRWLREHIGVVSQEPVLFNTTIAENIRYGRLGATMEEIQQATRQANAYNFISDLPDAFDTMVGERGTQLSGGQKQRIAIARALVRNPKILLLDEATSALDNESEKVVQEALDKAREGRTTIIIAHRLSTIQNADVIVSIQDGRVVEMGTHSELMDKEGLYFDLVTAQTMEKDKKESQKKASEPLAEFKAAVVRSASIRKQRSNSLRKRNTPSASSQPHNASSESGLAFERQTSHHSQFERQTSHHSQVENLQTPGIADHFSLEDLPVIAHPSPNPGRRAISVGPDDEIPDKVADEQEVTIKFDTAEDEDGEKARRASTKGLLKKDPEEPIHPVTFRELLSLNVPDWPFVVVGVLFSGVLGTFFPIISILFSNILKIYGYQDKDRIVTETSYYALGFVGLAVLAFVVNFAANFSLSVAGERLTKRMRLQSFQSMLRQEISWFDERAHATGALTTRLAVDASEVKGATGLRLGSIFQIASGFVAALIIAFVASWQLSLVLMLSFPLIAAVSFLQLRLIRGRTVQNKKLLEDSGKTAVESFENLRTVVGLGLGDTFCQIYRDQLAGPFRANLKSVLVQSVIIGIAQGTIFYLYAIGFRFGAYLVAFEDVSYNDIFRVFGAVVFTALSLGRATSLAPDASKAQLSAGRIMALLNRTSAVDASRSEGRKLDRPTGHVSLDSVFFNYITRPDIPILGGLSLDVKPGKTLALVGPSGCGKSTVVSLIERFYDPTNGSVRLEGEDIREFNVKWLRQQVGIVSQEPTLFDASVADNIRYGANFREVSEEEVVAAAMAANIHSFIETLPQGYNTNVGAKGTQLSGGQKQRIAIARALVRNPKILLLDEATSALDTESEKVVQEALDKAREGRTSIVIAHRLSTIYNSDCIAVIHKGQVLEQGTHAELMAKKGAYYHLNTVRDDEEDDGGYYDDNVC